MKLRIFSMVAIILAMVISTDSYARHRHHSPGVAIYYDWDPYYRNYYWDYYRDPNGLDYYDSYDYYPDYYYYRNYYYYPDYYYSEPRVGVEFRIR